MAVDLRVLHEGRRRFLELVAEVRPDLHRYCARMTGSVTDGEDVVQETLARAYYALSEVDTMPPLRPWLFRIAHARAIDHRRRYEVRMRDPDVGALDTAIDEAPGADDVLTRDEAVRAAIARFVGLPPAQRSCVILKDVLGHSLEEIAELLQLGVPAVKAALHRGRVRLRSLTDEDGSEHGLAPYPAALARYAALFNARDWDGVRALLADDVRLDLVSRVQRSGRRDVSEYFSNYSSFHDWHFVPAWLANAPVLAVFRDPRDATPSYFVILTMQDTTQGERLVLIRDFRYVPYIARDAQLLIA
ncbi:MAG: sigma-70 family RNA polymerase sigma factor [Polyangiales bacterium]